MNLDREPGVPTPAFVPQLLQLASAAMSGDATANAQLQLAGELLEFAGGSVALVNVLGLAHEYERGHPEFARGQNLTGTIGSSWKDLRSWTGR